MRLIPHAEGKRHRKGPPGGQFQACLHTLGVLSLWGTVSAHKAENQSWSWAALCPSGQEAEPTTQPQDTHCHLLSQFPASEFSSPSAQMATLLLRAILTWGGTILGHPSPTWWAPHRTPAPPHLPRQARPRGAHRWRPSCLTS